MSGEALLATTLPTVIGMGVVSQTTTTMFGKGRRGRTTKQKKFKIYQGKRGGRYIIRKGKVLE